MPSRELGTVAGGVGDYLARRGLTRRVREAEVVNAWPELVGPQLARVSSPRSVDASGTIWVEVVSTAWMQELQMMSAAILHELAKRGYRLKRIRWLCGMSDSLSRTDTPGGSRWETPRSRNRIDQGLTDDGERPSKV